MATSSRSLVNMVVTMKEGNPVRGRRAEPLSRYRVIVLTALLMTRRRL
ncbi:hypothetical protein C7S16_1281 [Burkholderia thailandensis]|uniref:Uncharacterized protein n=1 Tax=Burkholderia thailandensis TaxID=57975 RepID=A0AAW9D2U4_BURTH|nr:hypothetical protein [Burkholderia thailandensis]MDW9256666.1 hypothetical protein [Burkholderia thailandensis]